MGTLQSLEDRLRRHGLRITKQRAIILQALCELESHASAERVHDRVTLHRRDVDLSTVYRTLERMRDLGIVSQTDLGHGCTEYEVVGDKPHHHLVCQHCGRVIELEHGYLAPVTRRIRQDFGFSLTSSHFAIFGICRSCRGELQYGAAGSSLPEKDGSASAPSRSAPDRSITFQSE